MENAWVTSHQSRIDELAARYGNVTIARQLRRFASSLDLVPNAPSRPSSNMLPAILTGSRSWQAALRRVLGDLGFRNLKNYATGKVKRSAGIDALRTKFTSEVLELLLEILRDPATARLPQLLGSLESEVLRLARTLHTCQLAWRNKGAEEWWSGQQVKIGPAEAALIDRTCLVIIGAELVLKGQVDQLSKELRVDLIPTTERLRGLSQGLCVTVSASRATSEPEVVDRVSPIQAATELLLGFSAAASQVPSVWELAERKRHPFGNWLQAVIDHWHVSSPSGLVRMTDAAITPDSAMRYARGEMLTAEAARRLTNDIPNAAAFLTAVPAARAMAFAIEFLMATDGDGSLGEERARKIVGARVRGMHFDVHVAIMRITRRREKAMLAALDGYQFVYTGPDWSKLTLADLDGPIALWHRSPPNTSLELVETPAPAKDSGT